MRQAWTKVCAADAGEKNISTTVCQCGELSTFRSPGDLYIPLSSTTWIIVIVSLVRFDEHLCPFQSVVNVAELSIWSLRGENMITSHTPFVMSCTGYLSNTGSSVNCSYSSTSDCKMLLHRISSTSVYLPPRMHCIVVYCLQPTKTLHTWWLIWFVIVNAALAFLIQGIWIGYQRYVWSICSESVLSVSIRISRYLFNPLAVEFFFNILQGTRR